MPLALVMIAQAAAIQSALSAPVPQTFAGNWIRTDDYPQEALKRRMVGAVGTAITVDPDGRIIRCEIEKPSGSALLDTATCDLLSRQAKYSGGRDAVGQASYGVDRGTVRWLLPGEPASLSRSIQMGVQLEKMPKGLADPAFVRADVAVDAGGRVDACRIPELNTKNNPTPADIVQATRILGKHACALAVRDLTIQAARDDSGKAVASSQNIMVGFTARRQP